MRTITVLAVLALTAGCSSSASKPSVAPTSSVPAAAPAVPSSPAAPAPAPAAKAKVGTTVTIKAANGASIAVTLVKVVDPVKTTDGADPAPAGQRFVGVQLKIVNKGPGRLDDVPMYGLHGADGQGQTLNIEIGLPTTAGPALDELSGVRLSAGDTALGFVTFQVPDGAKVARVQYTPTGGGTAEWALG